MITGTGSVGVMKELLAHGAKVDAREWRRVTVHVDGAVLACLPRGAPREPLVRVPATQ